MAHSILHDFPHYALQAQAGTTYILYRHSKVKWAMLVKVTPDSSVELTLKPPYYAQDRSMKIALEYTISGNSFEITWNERFNLNVKQLLTQRSATLRFVLGFVCPHAVYIYKVIS